MLPPTPKDSSAGTARRERRPTPATPDAPAPLSLEDPDSEETRRLRPIGPKALAELREAIRSGRYPTEAHVRRGMERLLRRPR